MKCLFSSSFIPFSCLSTSLLKILFFSSYLPLLSSCFSSYSLLSSTHILFCLLFIFFFANVLSFSLLFLVFLVSCHSLSSTSHVFPFVMHLHFSPHDSLYYSVLPLHHLVRARAPQAHRKETVEKRTSPHPPLPKNANSQPPLSLTSPLLPPPSPSPPPLPIFAINDVIYLFGVYSSKKKPPKNMAVKTKN